MNLEYRPSPPPAGVTNTTGGTRRPYTDEEVAGFVAVKVSARTTEKAAALAALEAACTQAERDELNLGSGDHHTGTIRELVLRITQLEGELAYFALVNAGLGVSEE
jgi:hypothetical protein